MSEESKIIYHHSSYREAVEFAEKADKEMLVGGEHAGEPTFDPGSLVVVEHEDGAILYYRSAFIRKYRDYICVFTEHHGIHVYHYDDLSRCEQFQAVEGPRPKLKGSGKKDVCDDCKQEFNVDDLEYGNHPNWNRHWDQVALCSACHEKAKNVV